MNAVARDRRDWIIFFGAMQVLLALTLSFPLLALGLFSFFPGSPAHSLPDWLNARIILCPLGMTAFLAFTGVGLTLLRRWARSLLLIASWLWLVFLALGLLMTMVVFPQLPALLPPVFPAAAPRRFLAILPAVLFFILAVPPALAVAFYSSRGVRLAFSQQEPRGHWTESMSLPVFSLFFLLWLQAALYLLNLASPFPFPLFGLFLRGPAAKFLWLAAAVLNAFLALRVARLEPVGWTGSVLLSGFSLLSATVTFALGGMEEMVADLGFDFLVPEAFYTIHRDPVVFALLMVPLIAAAVVYLDWVRRRWPAASL